MMRYLCVLFPACIAMSIIYRRSNQKLITENILYDLFKYGEWVLCLNIINLFLIKYVMKIEDVDSAAFESFSFAFKYIVIECCFAIVLPYILEIIKKYFSITLMLGEKDEE